MNTVKRMAESRRKLRQVADIELVNKQNIKSVLDTINWLEMYGAKLVEKENGSI